MHVQSKPIQKMIYRLEVCFHPSIEISICAGSSGVNSKSSYAGCMSEVEPLLLALIEGQRSPCCFSKILHGGLSVSHLYRAPNIPISESEVDIPYSTKVTFPKSYLNQNITTYSSSIALGPIFSFQLRRKLNCSANLIS